MQHSSQQPTSEEPTKVLVTNGKDEMNLAEFPLGKLGKRDRRKVITYERMVRPKHGEPYLQKWEVHGAIELGLPDEAGDRVIVALMKLTAEQGFKSQKVTFSPYQILKMLGWKAEGKKTYDSLASILKQLVAITVFSDEAFYDNEKKKRVTYSKAFHIFEDMEWIQENDANEDVKISSGGSNKSYIVWSATIWKSLESGYIKNLNLDYYYSLANAIARRLYRFLDKWLYKQNEWEFDVFDVTDRLGMVRYRYPSEAKKSLKPACEELKNRGFLADYEFHKQGKYTRIHFVKVARPTLWDTLEDSADDQQTEQDKGEPTPQTAPILAEWEEVYKHYETSAELKTTWSNTLKELELSASQAVYQTHLVNTALLQIQDDVALIGTPNIVGADWLQNRMGRKIAQALSIHLETKISSVEFVSGRDKMESKVDEWTGCGRKELFINFQSHDSWFVPF